MAAVAAKALTSRRAAGAKASLLRRLQAGACQNVVHLRLLSSQRSQLLACRRACPLLHPRAALAGILRKSVGLHWKAGVQESGQAATVRPAGAADAPVADQKPPLAVRQLLNEAVLRHHKDAKKAWREKRWDFCSQI
jgi:hypothetical protein